MSRSPTTTGPAKPCPTRFCHTFRGPAAGHVVANGPVYTPFRVGPRNWGQSAAATDALAARKATTSARRTIGMAGNDITAYSFTAEGSGFRVQGSGFRVQRTTLGNRLHSERVKRLFFPFLAIAQLGVPASAQAPPDRPQV